MVHYGTLQEYRFSTDVDDIRGSHLYGRDDKKLGKITDVIFDHDTGVIRYAVVDTGVIGSDKFLVPATSIHSSEKHPEDFAIDATKDRIESLPKYDEKSLRENEGWSEYEDRYNEAWGSGPVLNKEGSTHMITPDPSELPAGSGSGETDRAYTPERITGVFTDPSPEASKLRMRPSGVAARAEDTSLPGAFQAEDKPTLAEHEAAERELRNPVEAQRDHLTDPDEVYVSERERSNRLSAFEDHLRRNRVDITASCRSCGTARDKVA